MCLALSLGTKVQTQLASKKTIDAIRIHQKISLDANLDETVWQTAATATDFTFLWPSPANLHLKRPFLGSCTMMLPCILMPIALTPTLTLFFTAFQNGMNWIIPTPFLSSSILTGMARTRFNLVSPPTMYNLTPNIRFTMPT
jgi:hypothetical protein